MSTSEYHLVAARPTLEDAVALLQAERHSLDDCPYTPEEIVEILRGPGQQVCLAWQGPTPVGFCAGLVTPSGAESRLEIDLLGVAPEHRRHGLGTRLVAESVAMARSRGITRFRGLAAVRNKASQGAFTRAGLAAVRRVRMLLYELRGTHPQPFLPPDHRWLVEQGESLPPGEACLAAPLGAEPSWWRFRLLFGETTVAESACLRVQTLTYCGLWVETLWAASEEARRVMARGLVEEAKPRDLDEVGYLLPQTLSPSRPGEPPAEVSLIREGYRTVGNYLVFEA